MVTNMYLINYSQNEIEQIVILEKIGLLWKPSFFDPLNTSALKVVVQKKKCHSTKNEQVSSRVKKSNFDSTAGKLCIWRRCTAIVRYHKIDNCKKDFFPLNETIYRQSGTF